MSIMTRATLTPTPASTGVAQTWASLAPRAGWYEDQEQKDNDLGPMPDETEQCHRLVWQLVADGDYRAWKAERRARRTLAEMAPGYERQPVLLLTRPLPMRGATDACPVCTRWNCDPSNCPPSFAPAPASAASARTAVAR